MTDLERFIDLYKSFGIELKVETINGELVVQMNAKENGFIGYSGFGSDVIFDINGKFKEQGFWE